MALKKISIVFLIILSATLCFAGPQDTSSTTGTNMIARARVYLDESTALKWSEATLLQFLNDGMVDIAMRSGAYQGSESINLVANTVEYTPTGKYIKILAVKCNPASGESWALKHGNISSLGKARKVDTPEYWYEFDGKVGVYPAYSAVTTETITVYYVERPASIAAGASVLTPYYLDRALVYYIVSQALLADHRYEESANYLNLYYQEIERYRQDFIGADNETTDPVR